MKDCIIIPTYNECNNIRTLVPRLFSLYPDIHVLVVDDNSPDGTARVVKELQHTFPNLHLRERQGKLGLASAYTETFEYLLEKYPTLQTIITMDGDLSHDPMAIDAMLKASESFGLVIGSRYVTGGSVENWEIGRQILSRGGNLYSRYISGIPINDITAGYQCFRADLLRHERFRHITATGFAFQMELKMFAYSLNAKILELPIIFKNRVDGVSKISNHIVYEGLIVPWQLRRRLKTLAREECRLDNTPSTTESVMNQK